MTLSCRPSASCCEPPPEPAAERLMLISCFLQDLKRYWWIHFLRSCIRHACQGLVRETERVCCLLALIIQQPSKTAMTSRAATSKLTDTRQYCIMHNRIQLSAPQRQCAASRAHVRVLHLHLRPPACRRSQFRRSRPAWRAGLLPGNYDSCYRSSACVGCACAVVECSTVVFTFYTGVAQSRSGSSSFTASALNTLSSSCVQASFE